MSTQRSDPSKTVDGGTMTPDPATPAAALVQRLEPSIRAVSAAIGASVLSPCRSKRGAVVFHEELGWTRIWARGHNSTPDCDGSPRCKATCRTRAVHAEQAALIRAGLHALGRDLLHVKTIDGQLVPSGGPSCVECSKLALAARIAGVWLYHENGWHRYDATEFHRQSLAAAALRGGGSSHTGETPGLERAINIVEGVTGVDPDTLLLIRERLCEAFREAAPFSSPAPSGQKKDDDERH
jgi:deoxycytidylate deaminase